MAMAILAVLVAMGLSENAQNSASVSVRSYYMSAILKMRYYGHKCQWEVAPIKN